MSSRKILLIAVCFVPSFAYARWAGKDDAALIYDFARHIVKINPDESYSEVIEKQYTVQNEVGRDTGSQLVIEYYAGLESVELLEARVTTNGKTTEISKELVENKPVASDYDALEQRQQFKLLLPSVKVGSKVYLKYLQVAHNQSKVPFSFMLYDLADDGYYRSFRASITSPRKLFYEKHDPFQILAIDDRWQVGMHKVDVHFKKPVYMALLDEDSGSKGREQTTSFYATTARNLQEAFAIESAGYEEVLKEPLPEPLLKIATELKGTPASPELLLAATERVVPLLRYFRMYLDATSGIRPRSLGAIVESAFGDCKDYTVALIAVLRALGVQAFPAIIYAGEWPEIEPRVASTSPYNHAIAWMRLGPDEYWIDPTQEVAYLGVTSDIANRRALILEPGNIAYRTTPAIDPKLQQRSEAKTFALTGRKTAASFALELTGTQALEWIGLEQSWTRKSINEELVRTLNINRDYDRFQVDAYNLLRKRYHPLLFSGSIQYSQSPFEKNSVGSGFYWSPGDEAELLASPMGKRDGGVLLPGVGQFRYQETFKNVSLAGKPRSCEVKSKWLNISRSLEVVGSDIRLTQEQMVAVDFIENKVLRSGEFRDFQSRLRKCVERFSVIFTPAKEGVGR